MKANIMNYNEAVLGELIENALLNSMLWINSRCSIPHEPDYVMALSTKFIKELFNILVAVFPDYNFSVSSVFCHQKPIVDICLDKNPELGDILFVYADRKENGGKLINSLLFQAKISNCPSLRIYKDEKHQLELYRRWPEFTYCRAGILNGTKRDILPKTINDGAQYLLINSNPLTNRCPFSDGIFTMGCAVPDDNLCINNSLSKELVDLIKFKAGRTIDNNPYSTEDGWSKMIWDLLRIAAFKYSKRKNAKISSFSRISEYNHLCSENMRGSTLLDEALDGINMKADYMDDIMGVSVVLIESQLKGREE